MDKKRKKNRKYMNLQDKETIWKFAVKDNDLSV